MDMTFPDMDPPTKKMKIKFKRQGGHTHISVWTGPLNGQVGKAGELVMTNEEFHEFKNGWIDMEFEDLGGN